MSIMFIILEKELILEYRVFMVCRLLEDIIFPVFRFGSLNHLPPFLESPFSLLRFLSSFVGGLVLMIRVVLFSSVTYFILLRDFSLVRLNKLEVTSFK